MPSENPRENPGKYIYIRSEGEIKMKVLVVQVEKDKNRLKTIICRTYGFRWQMVLTAVLNLVRSSASTTSVGSAFH